MNIIYNPAASSCICFAFEGRNMAVQTSGAQLTLNDMLAIRQSCGAKVFFEEKENNICALLIDNVEALPEGYKMVPLRSFFFNPEHGVEEVYRASRAKGVASWLTDNKFCCKCGSKLVLRKVESALECPDCKQVVYPRINPCIITLVHRGNKVLLARHAQRNTQMYACIAGFIESGETPEHAVAREVMEETGLKVHNIKYFGSQSWPFPSQLMLAFTAEYESGDIKVQESEIADADWFDPNDTRVDTPQPGSIAHMLIEDAKKKASNR